MTATLSRAVIIAAPQSEVFTFISNPEKMLDWIPTMEEISEVTGEGKATKYGWAYTGGGFTPTLAGLQLTGQSVVTEYSPPTRLTRRTNGLAHSIWDFQLKPVGEGTELTLHITYKVPLPLLGRPIASWMARTNAADLELALQNVKRVVELSTAKAAPAPHQPGPAADTPAFTAELQPAAE